MINISKSVSEHRCAALAPFMAFPTFTTGSALRLKTTAHVAAASVKDGLS
jgi:hypothetical protein